MENKIELNAEQERITKNLNNELYDYVKRIVAAVKYNGEGDHEDVPSILKEFAKGYEQRIKELTEENEVRKRCNTMLNNELRRIDNIKADTVRKMQEDLKSCFCPDCDYSGYDVRRVIDLKAKEMVEGDK